MLHIPLKITRVFKNYLHAYPTEWIISFLENSQICSQSNILLRFVLYVILLQV